MKITINISEGNEKIPRRYLNEIMHKPNCSVEYFVEKEIGDLIDYAYDELASIDEEQDQKCKQEPDAYCHGCGDCEVNE